MNNESFLTNSSSKLSHWMRCGNKDLLPIVVSGLRVDWIVFSVILAPKYILNTLKENENSSHTSDREKWL